MKQTICYMYEFEGNKSIKNVGFLKCIFQKEKVTFQIYGKSLDCDKGMNLEMFLFTSDGESCIRDRAGIVEGLQGSVNYRVTIDDLNIEKWNTYDGVLLVSKNQKQYVAMWKRKNISLVEKCVKVDEDCTYETEMVETHSTCDAYELEVKNVCDVCEPEEVDACEVCESEAIDECRVCESEVMDECDVCEVCEPQVVDACTGIQYEKIDRYGISHLPQREWKLANNNFVLHGYNNYKHLMIMRESDQVCLGVPGVYYRKEEAVAKSFGFPVFRAVNPDELGLKAIEYSREGTFGYWCRPVLERRRWERRNESKS